MALCPLCNGLRAIHIPCADCGTEMKDKGKTMDYEDDYSAYMDIDILKKNDGVKDSLQKGICPHLLFCPSCGHDETVLIKE